MRAVAPNVLSWTQQMLDPKDEGELETWDDLAPTLMPLLKEIGQTFLPWSVANAKALAAGEKTCSAMLRGREYAQGTQNTMPDLLACYANVMPRLHRKRP